MTAANRCNVSGHEVCVNTEGGFRCDCADKYRKNSTSAACEGKQFVDSDKNDDDKNDRIAIMKMIMYFSVPECV